MNKFGSLMFHKLVSPLENGFRLMLAKTATRWSSVFMQYNALLQELSMKFFWCDTSMQIFYIVEDTQITLPKAFRQLRILSWHDKDGISLFCFSIAF